MAAQSAPAAGRRDAAGAPASTARRRNCRVAGIRAAGGRRARANRKPPLKASPAPVVSTARTRGAGSRHVDAVPAAADPAAAARSELDDRVARRPAPERESPARSAASAHTTPLRPRSRRRSRGCRRAPPNPRRRPQRRVPAEIPRRRHAARAQALDDGGSSARSCRGANAKWTCAGALPRDRGRQPRLQAIVDAVEGDEAAIAPRRQRDGDRMRLRRPLHVDDAHRLGAQRSAPPRR